MESIDAVLSVFFRSKVDLWKGLSNEFSVQFSVSVNDAQEYSD